MPRLFPSLGRSSKDRGGAYGQYEGYDAPQGYYDYGYAEQEPRQNRSPWSKVLNRKSTKRGYIREDPNMGMNLPMHPHGGGGGYRTTVEDYPEDPRDPRGMPGMPGDDSESFEDLLSGRHSDTTIPLVQRESSLTRIQNAFADNGTFAPALSATPSMGMYAPQPRPPHGTPHLTSMHNLRQPPMVIDGGVPIQGLRPDIVHHSASYPTHERPHHRHREREPSAPPRAHSSQGYRDHPAYWEHPLDSNEEPPVVVVVEHGKNGKKDKYYIIPAGAPVVFEDEAGNELTRVGDFSGRYRPPRRPRPVIVQDQYGHEICRAGFSHDDHISVGSRDNRSHHSHHTSGSSRSDRRGRPAERAYDQREHTSHHSSSRSARAYAPGSYHDDPHYQPSRPRAGTRSSRDDPDVVFIDHTRDRNARSGRSGSSSDTLVRSSPHDGRDHYDRHSSSGRSHDRDRTRDYVPEERERGREYHRREHHTSSRRPRDTSSRSGSYDSYDDRDRHYRSRDRGWDERYGYDDRYDYD